MSLNHRSVDDFQIDIDLCTAQRASESVKSQLLALRQEYDLGQFEYTTTVRIAPGEILHSHPVLTLNTIPKSPDALICAYLHEQMHWYENWFAATHAIEWSAIHAALRNRFPTIPIAFPEGATTEDSSYLHLVVNWLEIEAAAFVLPRETVTGIAAKSFVYSGLYRLVIDHWDDLDDLYRATGLVPIKRATAMSEEDLTLAGQVSEEDLKALAGIIH